MTHTNVVTTAMWALAACTVGERPLDGRDAGAPDSATDSGPVCPSTRECPGECCAPGSVCDSNEICCPLRYLCGTECCGAREVCEGAACHLDCAAAARCEDSTGAEVCCADGEVCASGRCIAPTVRCSDFVDCAPGEYCDSVLRFCLPQPGGDACVLPPAVGGGIAPTLVWHWDGSAASDAPGSNNVMTTPIVVQLTDDDESGTIDRFDVPDVVFTTFFGSSYSIDGILRAVRGENGAELWNASMPVSAMSTPAAGDLDGDGYVEIVTCSSAGRDHGNRLLAFKHDGSIFWESTDSRIHCPAASPSIADLDADGTPEVFVRYSVVDGPSGALEWHHECRNAAGRSTLGEAAPCDFTTAADLDDDGMLEVVGGNMAYRADGSVYYDRSADLSDGYPAVADLDLDGAPEVVVVHNRTSPAGPDYRGEHWVRALRSDGSSLWGPIDVNADLAPAGAVAGDVVTGGGTPTIANFDDDPSPEVALAGGWGYLVLEHDGTTKWAAPTRDLSSRTTGSSVFDFDGDGTAEAVYNDEYWLRVYDGPTGEVRYCECNTTATLNEYPVIADVDGDEHAEIIVASNDYGWTACTADSASDPCTRERVARGETEGSHGVRVFAGPDRDWLPTRRIWNQHAYHVTNVDEDGRIPVREAPNHRVGGLNNFRQNVRPGATNAPDLVVAELSVDVRACPDTMVVYARVHNAGWSGAIDGVPVRLFVVEADGTETPITTAHTTRFLLPGESELLRFDVDVHTRDYAAPVLFRARIDSAASLTEECRVENNVADHVARCPMFG